MRKTVLALLALTLVVAACGDDDTAVTTAPTTTTVAATTLATTTTQPATTTTAAAFPVTVLGTTIETEPGRIVSLSASHTEMLFALGAGSSVIATDVFSNYPVDAESTEKIDSFNLNVEQVIGLDPDLVLLAFDPGDAVDSFAAVGIPAVLFPAPVTLDEAYQQWLDVGAMTGTTDAAQAAVRDARERVTAIVDRLPQTLRAPTYFHELDPLLFSVTSSTFLGDVYGRLGLENVADPADDAGFGYPQLSAEFLVDVDPDYVFLADTKCCGETPETFAERPALGTLTAVASGRVIALDDDRASRWGPRIIDFLEDVAATIYPDTFGS